MEPAKNDFVFIARIIAWSFLTISSLLFLLIALPKGLTSLVLERDAIVGVCQTRGPIGHFDSLAMLGTKELAGCQISEKANTIRGFGVIFLILFAIGFVIAAISIAEWEPESAESVAKNAVQTVGFCLLALAALAVAAIILFFYIMVISALYMLALMAVIVGTSSRD